MIGESNQVQRSSNFAGMITNDLWTYQRKESTNHSIVWEESRNSRARTGFSLERQELRFEWTHDSRKISTRLDGLESLQRVTRSSENHSSSRTKSSKTRHKSYEIELNSKPRRAQGGLGLLSWSISVQKSQQSIPKVLILERRGRNRERTPGRRWWRAGHWEKEEREREREGVRGYLTPTTLNL